MIDEKTPEPKLASLNKARIVKKDQLQNSKENEKKITGSNALYSTNLICRWSSEINLLDANTNIFQTCMDKMPNLERQHGNEIGYYKSTVYQILQAFKPFQKIPRISRSSFAVQAACTGPRRPTKYTFLYMQHKFRTMYVM